MLQNFDRDALRKSYSSAVPFPFVHIDNFVNPDFAKELARSYPTFEEASTKGTAFNKLNQRKKVQISAATSFPDPVARLNDALASPQFLSDLGYITCLPNLLADPELVGGGMHITGPGGRLDVHVDFNYIEERKLHRRLNLLLYLNPVWDEQWGGHIQLWDRDVKHCVSSFAPKLNRCVIFETSDISYHGVTPITADAPMPRQSFATYYYTKEAPAHWTGEYHNTIFKARPNEWVRGKILMPARLAKAKLAAGIDRLKGQ
jgi:Rps23 Pro-64 3,4-dihydroxylase Tpa1-like proline 4-hydroxylase